MKSTRSINNAYEHWVGMPDFEQEKQAPYACVNVRFENEEDLIRFSQLTGLKLTSKTKSAWFPEAKPKDTGYKRWV